MYLLQNKELIAIQHCVNSCSFHIYRWKHVIRILSSIEINFMQNEIVDPYNGVNGQPTPKKSPNSCRRFSIHIW